MQIRNNIKLDISNEFKEQLKECFKNQCLQGGKVEVIFNGNAVDSDTYIDNIEKSIFTGQRILIIEKILKKLK